MVPLPPAASSGRASAGTKEAKAGGGRLAVGDALMRARGAEPKEAKAGGAGLAADDAQRMRARIAELVSLSDADGERRIDPSDGNAYTRKQFDGRALAWDRALPVAASPTRSGKQPDDQPESQRPASAPRARCWQPRRPPPRPPQLEGSPAVRRAPPPLLRRHRRYKFERVLNRSGGSGSVPT